MNTFPAVSSIDQETPQQFQKNRLAQNSLAENPSFLSDRNKLVS